MKKKNLKLGLVGTGSWGLALSLALSKTKNNIIVFFKSEEQMKLIQKTGQSKYLPDTNIPRKIKLTHNYEDIKYCDFIFLVTPSQTIRKNLEDLLKNKVESRNFVICSKGIERETNKLMSEVLKDVMPANNSIIFSGPNFAHEVAANLPTAFVLSSKKQKLAKDLGNEISTKNFRPYFNSDIIGTQIGGSMKNIIAISCGIVVGKKLGENARSAIITRGLKEIIDLGKSMGAEEKTFYGLSGLGDLNLSCNSRKSRNMNLGYELANGRNITTILQDSKLSEGVHSCDAICAIGKKNGVELPICNAIQKILNGESIDDIIFNLLSRPLQPEV